MFARRGFLTSGLGLAAATGLAQSGRVLANRSSVTGLKGMGNPWPLRDSEAFEYQSKAVGDKMAIGIWSPPEMFFARMGKKKPPLDIIYVLDGSFMLGMAASMCLLHTGDALNPGFTPVLLVGLDYPIGQINSRSRDYMPVNSAPPSMKEKLFALPQTTPGGADKFLAFLETELDPLIRSKYNVSDRPAGILGDSAGGCFTYYAFLRQSKLFDRYWLGSPGVFTSEVDYIALVDGILKGTLVHPTKLFLSVGSRELAGGHDGFEDMGRNYTRLVSALNRHPNERLSWASKIYDGHTHSSVIAPAMNEALIYLYGKGPRYS